MIRRFLEERTARLRSIGLREAFTIDPSTWRRMLKSTVAGTVAWEAAALIHSPRPVLASLGAVLVVQVTVRATLWRSIQLTVAVTVGLAASVLLGHLLGLHWWSVGITILGGLVVGELLRLGPFSNQVALSALFALSLGSAYGYQRMIDTALGAGIGVLVNALIAPPTYVQEASRALRRVGDALGALLADISAGLAESPERAIVQRWLSRAREIADTVQAADATVSKGDESLRFNHRARAEFERLQRIGEAQLAFEHAVTQTRGMVRSMLDIDAQLRDPGLAPVLAALADLLRELHVQVTAFRPAARAPGPARGARQVRQRAPRRSGRARPGRRRAAHSPRG
jgi:uncharacterized membrane protein YccC